MKNFEDFKSSLDVGAMAYAARQAAVDQAETLELSPEEQLVHTQSAATAILVLDILGRYHEWLHSDT